MSNNIATTAVPAISGGDSENTAPIDWTADDNGRVGETKTTSFGLTVRIASYENSHNMTVEFVDVGVTKKNVTYCNFQKGLIKCPMIFKTEGSITECVNPNLNISFLIDTDDIPKVDGVLWSQNDKGYVYNDRRGKLHKIVMPSSGQNEDIDHINGIKTDNRKENLRSCTRGQNNMNKHSTKSTSGYKGVSWCKRDRKWVANIFYNRKHIFLGRFENIHEAAKAYNRAAEKLFGEVAHLNQIKEA